MKADIAKVKASPSVFITTNMYGLSPTEYKKLLKDGITKTYKKVTPCLENDINFERLQKTLS